MLKGLAIGIEHFPGYKPYQPVTRKFGNLVFAAGLNVLIGSDIEQGMTDEEFDRYSREFSVRVPDIGSNSVRFEELVFG